MSTGGSSTLLPPNAPAGLVLLQTSLLVTNIQQKAAQLSSALLSTPQSLLSMAAVRSRVPCSASVQGTLGTKMAMSADIGWLVKNLKHQGCTLRCPSKNHDCLASAELVHWGRRGENLEQPSWAAQLQGPCRSIYMGNSIMKWRILSYNTHTTPPLLDGD